jgi:hypothetical protein
MRPTLFRIEPRPGARSCVSLLRGLTGRVRLALALPARWKLQPPVRVSL